MDNLTKDQRSLCMSKIKSKWTKPEIIVHSLLKKEKINHRMHPKIAGSPDLIIPNRKIAIFINGCFWHKCPKCYSEPKTNFDYWTKKVSRNAKRDKLNYNLVKKEGFKTIIIWGHEIKKQKNKLLKKIEKLK